MTDARLTVQEAAKLMNVTEQFLRIGLRQNAFPFGYAVRMERQWRYFISRAKFEEYTGIEVDADAC